MLPRWTSWAWTAAIGLAAMGCAHDRWDGRVYHGEDVTFRLGPVPSSWERASVPGTMLSFRDRRSTAAIHVQARCGQDADDVPLTALTRHLMIGFTEREYRLEKVVPLDGREALHSVIAAKLDGVPVQLSLYVLKKDGCVYDFGYVASPGRFDVGIADFDGFVGGFHTE